MKKLPLVKILVVVVLSLFFELSISESTHAETTNIKKSDVSFVFSPKVDGSLQGGTITEKYYVYADHHGENNNVVKIADRNSGKIVKRLGKTNWLKHAGNFIYEWGSNHVRLVSRSGNSDGTDYCLDLNGFSYSTNTSSCPKRTPGVSAEGTIQGAARHNGYIFRTSFSGRTGIITVYKESGKKYVKTFKIPESSRSGGQDCNELENISVDGATGDVYAGYHCSGGGKADLYKIKASAFEGLTQGNGQTNADGQNGARELTELEETIWSQNNILFYEPCGETNDEICGTNKNYKGDQVWTDKQMEALKANQSIYETAAKKYGFPWQLLAVIHLREHGLAKSNPGNGQGPYQFYSAEERSKCTAETGASFAAGALSDEEFAKHTECAAKRISEGYGSGLDLTKDDDIKKMFFRYNGQAEVYKQQALNLGFSQEEADRGEGSPYVMNRYDAKREPSSTWGQIKTDGGSISYPANNDFGAFVYYKAITCDGITTTAADATDGGSSGSATTNTTSTSGTTASTSSSSSTSYSSDSGASNKLATTAISFAQENRDNSKTPIKAYADAVKEIYGNVSAGMDCGHYVATTLIKSGVDENVVKGLVPDMKAYFDKTPSIYTKVEADGSDESQLQSGDILVRNDGGGHYGHILFYVKKDGKGYQAEAQEGSEYPYLEDWDNEGNTYVVYRTQSTPSCVTSDCTQGNMNVNATAVCLAWPYGTERSKYTFSEGGTGYGKFSEAYSLVAKSFTKSKLPKAAAGASCDRFVGVVVRYSGVDEKFGMWAGRGESDNLVLRHALNNPDTWDVLTGTKEDLKPGDVLWFEKHVAIYIEDQNGQGYTVEASYSNGYFGRVSKKGASNPDFIIRAKEGKAKNSTAGVDVKNGVSSSASGSATSVSSTSTNKITQTAIKLAWPVGTSKSTYNYPGGKATDAYNQAAKENNVSYEGKDGTDCGLFVKTVVRASGVDDDPPNYWEGSNDNWEVISWPKSDWDKASMVQDGDILRCVRSSSSGHWSIAVDLGNGKLGKAEASHGDFFGKLKKKFSSAHGCKKQYILRSKNAGGTTDDTCDPCKGNEEDSGTGLKEGGFQSVEEARKFMEPYRNEASKRILKHGYMFDGAWVGNTGATPKDGDLNNCTAFSQWFLNRYTSLGPKGSPAKDGSAMVGALKAKGFKTGTEPRPYAIFSWNPANNHTGVILGVNGDKVIVGEASYHNGFTSKYPNANEYTISYMKSVGTTYAYTEDFLKGGF